MLHPYLANVNNICKTYSLFLSLLQENDVKVTLIMEVNYPYRLNRLVDGTSDNGLRRLVRANAVDVWFPSCVPDPIPNCRPENLRVTIRGSLTNADRARHIIRVNHISYFYFVFIILDCLFLLDVKKHMPIGFVICCRVDLINVVGIKFLAAHFASTFQVTLFFKLVVEDDCYQVTLRGCKRYLHRLREAVVHFCHLAATPSVIDVFPYSTFQKTCFPPCQYIGVYGDGV